MKHHALTFLFFLALGACCGVLAWVCCAPWRAE